MPNENLESTYLRRIFIAIIIFSFVVLSFLLIHPVALSIISGVLLAFIFNPVYEYLYKKTKSKNFSASILCVILLILFVLPIWFFTPIILRQSLNLYIDAKNMDFVTPLKSIFPSFFASEQFSSEVGSIINSFVVRTAKSLVDSMSNLILNFLTIMLQVVVVFFTFFFVLRDKDKLIPFLKSISPFSKEVEDKLFEYSKGITYSVLYGQIIVGLIQGAIMGVGLFIFRVPNALFLTILSLLAGVFPIIGPTVIWIPTAIYLVFAGSVFPAFGVIVFGIFASIVDNLLRPLIISRRTNVPSPVILIGMIGGLFYFGILGILIGPLILSYLLVGIEIYRKRKKSDKDIFVSKEN
jgi:predicted PurR-regulated permease PerM